MVRLAAKQEAFEESIRLKNQFRNLDEDEIEFLDSVLESTRAQEAAIKRETDEQLDLFRRQQEEVDKALSINTDDVDDAIVLGNHNSPTSTESQWAINARKRKRTEREGLKGVKIRKSSTSETPVALNSDPGSTLRRAKVDREVVDNDRYKSDEDALPTKPVSSPNPIASHTASSVPETNQAVKLNLGLAGYSSDEQE